MDKKTMLERFLAAYDQAVYFERLGDAIAANGMSAETRDILNQEGRVWYDKLWTLWENVTPANKDYVRAWRPEVLTFVSDLCQAYVADDAWTEPDTRYPVGELSRVVDWIAARSYPDGCNRHTYVEFRHNDEHEIYFSCLSKNQDGQGNDK